MDRLIKNLPVVVQHLIGEMNVEHRQKFKNVCEEIITLKCGLCDEITKNNDLPYNLPIKYGHIEHYCMNCIDECLYPSLIYNTPGYIANRVLFYYETHYEEDYRRRFRTFD